MVLGTPTIELDPDTPVRVFGDIWPLALRHGLTTYDAAYLVLALRRGLPLATLDAKLARAASREGVALA